MPGLASGIAVAWRTAPLYLAAFCIAYPFALLELNIDYYDWLGLLPAAALLLALAGSILWIFRRVLRHDRLAGLATLSVLMALFPGSVGLLPAFAVVAIGGVALAGLALLRRHRSGNSLLPGNFTVIANVAATAACLAVGFAHLKSQFESAREAERIAAERLAALPQRLPNLSPDALPHIVHIVLDGYSRADILQDTYGFDNTPFLNALRARGFRVASGATTPFNQTLFVMSSIFSLGHITDHDDFEPPEVDDPDYRNMLASVLRNGAVPQFLQALGYDLKTAPATYAPLQPADLVGPDGKPSGFGRLGFRNTYIFAYDMLNQAPMLAPPARRLLGSWLDVVAVNYHFLKQVPERRFEPATGQPLFAYQHILAPHPPFNITPEGAARPLGGFPSALSDASVIVRGDAAKREQYRAGYVDKLRYINSAILPQIDAIKARLPGPLIIILHGDHGGGMHHDLNSKTRTCVAERFSPLLAVYATEPKVLAEISDDFSIVNLYRAIFRAILGVDLPDLPDRSAFISWELDRASPVHAHEREMPCPAPMRDHVASPGR